MKRLLLLLVAVVAVFTGYSREDRLTAMLQACLMREEVSPDSIVYNLKVLEDELRLSTGVRRAVTAACLAQLYAQHAYEDVTGAWTARSSELYREALSCKDDLYGARTKDWIPLVRQGRNGKIYGDNMLFVVWYSASRYMPDSLSVSKQELIDYYAARGNLSPAVANAELLRLQKANDSIWNRAPRLCVRMAQVYYPGDSLNVEFESENVTGVRYAVYTRKGRLLEKSMKCAPLTPGRYLLKATCRADVRLNRTPKQVVAEFVVSRLQAFVQDVPGSLVNEKNVRVTVVDAKSGRPCPDAKVSVDRVDHSVRVSLDADSCLPKIKYWQTYTYSEPQRRFIRHTEVYTDRSIYRPGQEVCVSALVYEQKHWDARTIASQDIRIELQDAGGKVIAVSDTKTDEFGVAVARFSLPEKVERLGWFTIRAAGGSRRIKVEEYKRPEFYVELDDAKTWCRRDSTVFVTGQANSYNGMPLRNARVTASVQRHCCWWWRGMRNTGLVGLDTVFTDRNGRFVLPVNIEGSGSMMRYYPSMSVNVSVLSTTGESHDASGYLRLFDDPAPERESSRTDKRKWAECPKDTFGMGEPARLEFRNDTGRPMFVFVTGFARERIVTDTVLEVRDTLQLFDIGYLDSYGDGMTVRATCVVGGVVRSSEFRLKLRMPRRDLTLHWDTFRDYTIPGASEEWTMKVARHDGSAARANVLLTVYDSSLDALCPNEWRLSLGMYHYLPFSAIRWNRSFDHGSLNAYQDFNVWTYRIKPYDFSEFESRYFELPRRKVFLSSKPVLYKMDSAIAPNLMSRLDAAGYATREETAQNGAASMANGSEESVEPRSDFEETALFSPLLRTDGNGLVSVAFRVPESLTTWSVRGVAHTPDMQYVVFDTMLVARKALMAQLIMPRFLRECDRVKIPVKITNSSESRQSGKTVVAVSGTTDNRMILRKTFDFGLEASVDTVFSVQMFVPEGIGGLSVRVTASGEADSDGEQREIPVLASTGEFTDSKALTLGAGESARIIWSDLFPVDATDRRVIIERNTNPEQSAIDALQKVALPDGDDVLSLAAAHYAVRKLGLPDSVIYINRVEALQNADGGMAWFSGFGSSAYCTAEVGYMFARLRNRDVNCDRVLRGICRYLLDSVNESINMREEHDRKWTATLYDLRIAYILTANGNVNEVTRKLVARILEHLPKDYRVQESEYIAIRLIVEKAFSGKVDREGLKTLALRLEHSDGVYLAYRSGAYPSIDRRIHIHTQVMEALNKTSESDVELQDMLKGMRRWLLNEKRTQGWSTPVNCVDAAYAILGKDYGPADQSVADVVTRDTIDILRKSSYTLNNDSDHEIWAAVYATYSLPFNKVEETCTELGVVAVPEGKSLKVGDNYKSRVLIKAERDYEYVRVTVPRGAALEPLVPLSGYGWQNGVGYYREIKDDCTEYFIESLPHGQYLLEDMFKVERQGEYSTGVPVVRCMYAEEFRGHGESAVLSVGK